MLVLRKLLKELESSLSSGRKGQEFYRIWLESGRRMSVKTQLVWGIAGQKSISEEEEIAIAH